MPDPSQRPVRSGSYSCSAQCLPVGTLTTFYCTRITAVERTSKIDGVLEWLSTVPTYTYMIGTYQVPTFSHCSGTKVKTSMNVFHLYRVGRPAADMRAWIKFCKKLKQKKTHSHNQ